MKNMNNDELKKEREKEALRKREAYIKNKNSDSSKIVEKKKLNLKSNNYFQLFSVIYSYLQLFSVIYSYFQLFTKTISTREPTG